jgi:hypothetical protein
MNTHDIINLVIKKFGGTRVKFAWVADDGIGFILGANLYRCTWLDSTVTIQRAAGSAEDSSGLHAFVVDNYSRWVEGVLNNLVRDKDGNMVAA